MFKTVFAGCIVSIAIGFYAKPRPAQIPSAQLARSGARQVIRIKGHVSKLLDGYGFVAADDGSRYFFHRSSLIEREFNTLKHGEACTFEIEESDPRGASAINVITFEELTQTKKELDR